MTNKLTIAMVCDPISDYTAGVFVSTKRFAELLTKKGHKVIFIASRSKEHPLDDYMNTSKVYRFPSILLPKTEKSFYIGFPSQRKLRQIFKEEKVDVVHILLPTPSAIVAGRVAKSLGIAVVSHSHSQPENVFLHLPKWMPKRLLNSLYNRYLAFVYGYAQALIYPTEFAENILKSLTSLPGVVISNGVDSSLFKKTDATTFKNTHYLFSQSKKILFVGRLHPEKSIETLIKAMVDIVKEEPETELLIVGGGHQEEELKTLVKKVSMAQSIHFLGKVSDSDLILSYSIADLFVLPSLAELEGMVVLEAMSCGLPILIADAPQSASKYFVTDNGFLFRPEDSRDLAEKALRILSDSTIRKVMSEASLRDVQKYDIHESVSKLEHLYYSLIKKV